MSSTPNCRLVLYDIEILHIDILGSQEYGDITLPRQQTAFFLQSQVESEDYSSAYFNHVTVFKAL